MREHTTLKIISGEIKEHFSGMAVEKMISLLKRSIERNNRETSNYNASHIKRFIPPVNHSCALIHRRSMPTLALYILYKYTAMKL
jgi:hypothetical protein